MHKVDGVLIPMPSMLDRGKVPPAPILSRRLGLHVTVTPNVAVEGLQ